MIGQTISYYRVVEKFGGNSYAEASLRKD